MHVGLNESGLVHDFYFPYVGQENHVAASDLAHKIGVWVDGAFSWLSTDEWDIKLSYHTGILVGRIVAQHDKLGIRLEFDDFVDSTQSAFVRNIEITNCRNESREIRIFFHQVFVISNSLDSDTVQYVPSRDALMHYKGHRTFVVGARHATGAPFQDYSVGLYGVEGHLGTYKDAEDGHLSRNSVEHGKVDSVVGLTCQLKGQDSARIHYWIAAGKSQREAFIIHQRLLDEGALHHMLTTATYWKDWLKPAETFADKLDAETRERFIRSLLTIKAHQDKRGAIIASADTSMLNYSRDTYVYAWPRDGAYAVWPLIRLGYILEPVHFFSFCRRALHEGGYLGHKYQADGSLGSSWHPYVHGDEWSPPIQSDETAIVLFMLQQFHEQHKDERFLREFYVTFVRPTANFLAGFVATNGLPQPSYDIWEEKFITSTYTTAVTYAALQGASQLADEFGDPDDALRWQTAAEDMKAAASVFYDETKGHLIKGIERHGKTTVPDTTLDLSSLYGAYMFGLFDRGSQEVTNTYQHVMTSLASHSGCAFPRYTGDMYNRVGAKPNPWPICSAWMAQYANEYGDDAAARKRLKFIEKHALPTGILAEQTNPDTNGIISVAPLTWAHAEYVSTLLDLENNTKGTAGER
jgi:GH15 family glucan-1,4-alpha-glucosidase